MPDPVGAKSAWMADVLGIMLPAENDAPPADNTSVPRPILPDCKPVRNHIAGPAHHVLCATHGHVYDEKVSMIIANSVKEYDAQYPIPRPIVEGVCKPSRGKMPYAPKAIVLCEVHGDVLDLDKGEVVANTMTMYYRAHPEHAPPPKPEEPPPDGPWNPFFHPVDDDPDMPFVIGPDGKKIFIAPNPHPLPPPLPPPPGTE